MSSIKDFEAFVKITGIYFERRLILFCITFEVSISHKFLGDTCVSYLVIVKCLSSLYCYLFSSFFVINSCSIILSILSRANSLTIRTTFI